MVLDLRLPVLVELFIVEYYVSVKKEDVPFMGNKLWLLL